MFLSYFFSFFPIEVVGSIVAASNASDALLHSSKTEIITLFGLLLGMTGKERMSKKDFWVSEEQSLVDPPHRFGRFMSYTRFRKLMRSIRLSSELRANDAHWEVRGIIDMFNLRRRSIVEPGHTVVVDEGMSQWLGSGGVTHGYPAAVKKIPSKPTSVGFEFKMIACCSSGICLAVELQEEAVHMKGAPFRKEFGSAGTSALLRLAHCARLQGSGRTIVADSAFASVKAALALSELNLGFIGPVKLSCAGYPKMTLMKELHSDGDHAAYITHAKDIDILALGWYSRKPRLFVSTVGDTQKNSIHKRRRLRSSADGGRYYESRDIPVPNVVQLYYEAANKVDIHNQRRAELGLEKHWGTWRPPIRVLSSLMAMSLVDAYFAYELDSETVGLTPIDMRMFTRQIVDALLKPSLQATGMSIRPF